MADEIETLDEDGLQTILHGLVSAAVQFVDGELAEQREKAAEYERAEPFGNEEEGRSQVVISEVRDAINGVLPSILRVVHGPEHVVAFEPRYHADPNEQARRIRLAKAQTDYVRYLYDANDGFLLTQSALKDGFVKRLGIAKYWLEPGETTVQRFERVPQEEAIALLIAEEERTGAPAEPQRPEEHEDGTVSFELPRTGAPRVRIKALPPEEFLFLQSARDAEDGLFFGHRTEKARGELRAMGVPEEFLAEHGHTDASLKDSAEEVARQPTDGRESDPEAGEANDDVLYVEGYARVDWDGDGIPELRRICMIGPGYQIIPGEQFNQPVKRLPFVWWTPSIEPHTIVGTGMYERVGDLQLINSTIVRATLDSLAASIFPRTEIVEGQVSIEDVLNTEIGAIIRTRQPGMIKPHMVPFVGKEALPILGFMDMVRERRTGQNNGALGLDADAMQSTTKSGVDTAVTMSQQHAELYARNFSEQFLKPLFKGVAGLLAEPGLQPHLVLARGEPLEFNPETWEPDLDVSCHVMLGTTFTEQKLQSLNLLKQTQEAIFQIYGPVNPLVTVAQYRETLARMAQLSGITDVDTFFQRVDPNWQPPQQEPQKSPEQIIAEAQVEIERMKAERELAIKQAELELKEREMLLKDDRERDKLAMEEQLRVKEMELKHAVDVKEAELRAEIAKSRQTTSAGPAEGGA